MPDFSKSVESVESKGKEVWIACKELWKELTAEFIGTLFLVLVGCGSTIARGAEFNEKLTFMEIALCFGLTVGVIVHMIVHVSGGHINPAVTVGIMVFGNIPYLKGILYIIAQLAGAIVGAALLFASLPSAYRSGFGLTLVNKDLNYGQAFEIEFFITFLLVFSVFMVMDPKREVARHEPMVIGFVVAACHIWAIKFTGASMNPARSFGPALIKNTWDGHWVYWVGPILGGIVAALVYKFVFAPTGRELAEKMSEEQNPISRDIEKKVVEEDVEAAAKETQQS